MFRDFKYLNDTQATTCMHVMNNNLSIIVTNIIPKCSTTNAIPVHIYVYIPILFVLLQNIVSLELHTRWQQCDTDSHGLGGPLWHQNVFLLNPPPKNPPKKTTTPKQNMMFTLLGTYGSNNGQTLTALCWLESFCSCCHRTGRHSIWGTQSKYV